MKSLLYVYRLKISRLNTDITTPILTNMLSRLFDKILVRIKKQRAFYEVFYVNGNTSLKCLVFNALYKAIKTDVWSYSQWHVLFFCFFLIMYGVICHQLQAHLLSFLRSDYFELTPYLLISDTIYWLELITVVQSVQKYLVWKKHPLLFFPVFQKIFKKTQKVYFRNNPSGYTNAVLSNPFYVTSTFLYPLQSSKNL